MNVQKINRLCLVVLVGANGLGWPASTAAAPHKQAMTAAAPAAVPVENEVIALQQALQVLAVTAPSFDAQQGLAQRYERPSLREPFVKVGSPLPVWLGRKGLALRSDHDAAPLLVPGPRKREGDGRSPAGALRLLQMRGYAQEAPAGVTLPYRPSGPLDRCVDDPEAAAYTQVTQAPPEGPPPWRSAEELRLPTEHYKYLVVADYNMHLPQRGAGSCIFLHVAPASGGPTAGCTALAEADLLVILRWLSADKNPVMLQLPEPAWSRARAQWKLPKELQPPSLVSPKLPIRRKQ